MIALRADLLDFTAAPAWGEPTMHGVRWRPDHWLCIDPAGGGGGGGGGGPAAGRIVDVRPGHEDPGPGWRRLDHRGRLVLPGFVDTHVHSAQLEVIGSFGSALLDWLERYTFPAEQAWRDPERARQGATRFLDALLAHGTTAAVVFPTVHKVGAEALFEAAAARGMRLVCGKVLMDRHAPEGLRDDVTQAERDCIELIERFHGRGRNAYALTVRFAPTSTPGQLAMAGALCAADASLYMQTHVAENRDEVRWVAELFPDARSYLDVYARAGLLHPRSVLAHGIWLDADDRALLAERGAQVAFCPSSNLFLGSGLCDWKALRDAGGAVSVASDVGGGTSLNLLRTLADGYKVQALAGQRLNAWVALHAATAGAAQSLGLAGEIGRLEPGLMADFCVWNWTAGVVDDIRLGRAGDLHEKVFAWMTLADDRHLASSWVAGRCLHQGHEGRDGA